MSFGLWQQKPPFEEETLTTGERIFVRVLGIWKSVKDLQNGEVPDLWCITDDKIVTPEKVAEFQQASTPAINVITADAAPAEQKLKAFLDANPDVVTLLGYTKA